MPKKPTNKELEQFAKTLSYIYEAGYVSRKRILWYSFVRGFFNGMGGFLGATVGIGLLIWIVSLVVGIPILGSFIEYLQNLSS